MQSTGVYWIPLYELLEERGLKVYLVNARHTKNLPGRKSDQAVPFSLQVSQVSQCVLATTYISFVICFMSAMRSPLAS